MEQAFEVNFDSIVGQTHNYSGLSYGNIASLINQQTVSNPREAALQGLEKMLFLHKLGLKQAVLPPQERPHLPTLRSLGFSGTDSEIIAKAFKEAPGLLLACGSAASMWAANAATTSPSCDTDDRRVHITPANLTTKFHRSIEYPTTSKAMKKILVGPRFNHHPVLPPGSTSQMKAQPIIPDSAEAMASQASTFLPLAVMLFSLQNIPLRYFPPARHTMPHKQ